MSFDGDAGPLAPLPVKSPTSSAAADAAAPAKGAKPKTRTGSRLPEGWTPADTPAARALAAELGDPQAVARELDRFRDHWAAQPGAKGRKSDWDATWRNWLRRAAEYTPRPRGNPREGPDWDQLMAQAIAADTADAADARALGGGAA
ncbi:hypothetical protein [Propionibacterium australiense]|uniref:hypothetical protein n=1 Tax=Propionibacterium australiense TaxID=119981 RepID=UPI001C7DBCC5|nr:hypothetical protein [Propionibacterium australiense]